MQEVRKSQNQGLRADLTWSINSGKMESSPWDFPGFRRLRAVASSSSLKGFRDTVTLRCWGHPQVGQLLVDNPGRLAAPVLCALFFTSCEAMEFAEVGYRREESPDLPVSLLMVLHALRLECEKSMEVTASSHRSCFFYCSRDSRDEAALSESVLTGARMKKR